MLQFKFLMAAAALSLAAGGVASSAPINQSGVGVTFAQSKTLGAGTARTFATVRNGQVQSLGVRISADAMHNLGSRESETSLALPKLGRVPFRTIVIDWNPHGHPPKHVYDVPHFDVHMYTIDEQARIKVSPTASEATLKPAASLVPPGYTSTVDVVPMMGVHYAPLSAGEFHGQPFTLTPNYGYYGRHFIFLEQMISKAYLESKPNISRSLAQPASVEVRGLYPSSYQVRFDAATNEYVLSFSGFRER